MGQNAAKVEKTESFEIKDGFLICKIPLCDTFLSANEKSVHIVTPGFRDSKLTFKNRPLKINVTGIVPAEIPYEKSKEPKENNRKLIKI